MRKQQRLPGSCLQLGLQKYRGRAMAPALDARQVGQGLPGFFCILARGFFAGENHAGGAIGNLAAVHFAHAAFDHRVQLVAVGEAAFRELPAAGLGSRVALGVAKVDFGNGIQVIAVDAVALLVLTGDAVEHERPGEITVGGLVALPACGAQVLSAGFAIHIAHQLQPEHAGHVVVARLNVAHGRQHRNRARGAGGLVPGGGQ